MPTVVNDDGQLMAKVGIMPTLNEELLTKPAIPIIMIQLRL
jgi:hypothetical protein